MERFALAEVQCRTAVAAAVQLAILMWRCSVRIMETVDEDV